MLALELTDLTRSVEVQGSSGAQLETSTPTRDLGTGGPCVAGFEALREVLQPRHMPRCKWRIAENSEHSEWHSFVFQVFQVFQMFQVFQVFHAMKPQESASVSARAIFRCRDGLLLLEGREPPQKHRPGTR